MAGVLIKSILKNETIKLGVGGVKTIFVMLCVDSNHLSSELQASVLTTHNVHITIIIIRSNKVPGVRTSWKYGELIFDIVKVLLVILHCLFPQSM